MRGVGNREEVLDEWDREHTAAMLKDKESGPEAVVQYW